jgi:predicted signal transduction protein with EAL and GGDEF domain
LAVGLGEIDNPDPAAEKIVSALVTLAHAMNLEVTAEGIETPANSNGSAHSAATPAKAGSSPDPDRRTS